MIVRSSDFLFTVKKIISNDLAFKESCWAGSGPNEALRASETAARRQSPLNYFSARKEKIRENK